MGAGKRSKSSGEMRQNVHGKAQEVPFALPRSGER